mgnify:CR=1 FL=1
MKKTNFNESVERFKERIKNDKKFKTQFATVMVASVVVVATAITVPAVIHNNRIKAEKNTVAPIIVQGENEIESLTEEAESTANEESQPALEVSETENTETKKPTEKKAQENKKNSSNTKPKQETVTASPQTTEHVWTQAEVDAIVTEIKQYAIDKGFVINSRLTTQGTSWRNPASTESTPERVKSRLHYCVDDIYTMGMNRFGYIPEESYLNVVAQQYTDSDGNTQWEIYVVY